jgi:ribose transport system permease protein
VTQVAGGLAGRSSELLLACLVIAIVAFMASAAPGFRNAYNLYVLLQAFSLLALVALAQLVVIAVGQLNVSVPAIGALGAISSGGLMQVYGVPPLLACAVAVFIGACAGALNGAIIVLTGISSFVITLASFSLLRGLVFALTKAQPFYNLPASFKAFGTAHWYGLPAITPLVLLVLIAFWLFFRRMPLGRDVLAVGANEQGAHLGRIPVARVKLLCQVASGSLAALAGVLTAARLQTAWPTVGETWLLPSFAAPIIGGAALTGGRVSILGLALAVAVITLAENALLQFEVDPYWFQLSVGLLLLIAVLTANLGKARGEFAR